MFRGLSALGNSRPVQGFKLSGVLEVSVVHGMGKSCYRRYSRLMMTADMCRALKPNCLGHEELAKLNLLQLYTLAIKYCPAS